MVPGFFCCNSGSLRFFTVFRYLNRSEITLGMEFSYYESLSFCLPVMHRNYCMEIRITQWSYRLPVLIAVIYLPFITGLHQGFLLIDVGLVILG